MNYCKQKKIVLTLKTTNIITKISFKNECMYYALKISTKIKRMSFQVYIYVHIIKIYF